MKGNKGKKARARRNSEGGEGAPALPVTTPDQTAAGNVKPPPLDQDVEAYIDRSLILDEDAKEGVRGLANRFKSRIELDYMHGDNHSYSSSVWDKYIANPGLALIIAAKYNRTEITSYLVFAHRRGRIGQISQADGEHALRFGVQRANSKIIGDILRLGIEAPITTEVIYR